MKKILPLAILFLFGIIVVYFYQGSGGNPRGGEERGAPELTIRRSDVYPDGTEIVVGSQNKDVLGFAITNHASSTIYAIDSFEFFPGISNRYVPGDIEDLKVYEGSTLLAGASNLLPSSTLATTSSPFLLPPKSSKNFVLRADISGSIPSTSTSTLMQIAVGRVHARDAATAPGSAEQPVYKEIDGRLLRPPGGGIDDSIKSALFYVIRGGRR